MAIAQLMKFCNHLRDFTTRTELLGTAVYHQSLQTLCTLLAPMAPHIASELWEVLLEAGGCMNLAQPKVVKYLTGFYIHACLQHTLNPVLILYVPA